MARGLEGLDPPMPLAQRQRGAEPSGAYPRRAAPPPPGPRRRDHSLATPRALEPARPSGRPVRKERSLNVLKGGPQEVTRRSVLLLVVAFPFVDFASRVVPVGVLLRVAVITGSSQGHHKSSRRSSRRSSSAWRSQERSRNRSRNRNRSRSHHSSRSRSRNRRESAGLRSGAAASSPPRSPAPHPPLTHRSPAAHPPLTGRSPAPSLSRTARSPPSVATGWRKVGGGGGRAAARLGREHPIENPPEHRVPDHVHHLRRRRAHRRRVRALPMVRPTRPSPQHALRPVPRLPTSWPRPTGPRGKSSPARASQQRLRLSNATVTRRDGYMP